MKLTSTFIYILYILQYIICIVDSTDTDDILSEALYYMYDELCSLCPPDNQSDQCMDSVETITAAWETSLSLVKYVTSISTFVRTSA